MNDLFRHIAACNNATLPGNRIPFLLDTYPVGFIDPALAPTLLAHHATQTNEGLHLTPATLPAVAQALSKSGLFQWRNEAFDVRATPDSPPLAQIDRGALPKFGIRAEGVHLNALVHRPDGPHLWVARRARNKLLDPGKLDHLVAGGVSAGMTTRETLLKEAEEEAGLPPELLATARHVAIVDYAMARPEGLRRDRLHCFDVTLPESFVPEPRDGEVEAFELWPLPEVLARVRDTDDFKFNVNLVLIDLFQRLGMA